MVLVDFECDSCKRKVNDEAFGIHEEKKLKCVCGKPMRRLYNFAPMGYFKPYWSEHMIREPGKIYIDSPQKEREVMKKNGLGWRR